MPGAFVSTLIFFFCFLVYKEADILHRSPKMVDTANILEIGAQLQDQTRYEVAFMCHVISRSLDVHLCISLYVPFCIYEKNILKCSQGMFENSRGK